MATNESVRHQLNGTDTMKKYHGEIERLVFASEVYCTKYNDIICSGNILDCPFFEQGICNLIIMRGLIGDHYA